jgi:hypothetical protein
VETTKYADVLGKRWKRTEEIENDSENANLPGQMKSEETMSVGSGVIRGNARTQKSDQSEGYKATTVESSTWKILMK